MNLKNLKVNFLGDSITEGHGTSGPDKQFHQLIAKKYGLAAARNYGISGTRLAKQQTPTASNPKFDRDFCSRFDEMEDDADLIVVFGGTNDFGHGDAPIGEMSDRTSETFFGACHYLMSGLINKYPESKIVFMTPLHRVSESNKNVNGVDLECYVNIIKRVAAYYSLPVIDLWSCSGIQPCVPIIKEKYCPDGLHPNDKGHERLAEVVGSFLSNL
ncbi:MAG: SGNH/GDSL hydrolase family protein [Ruminococcaceae bacterium]|nr:SGNH/GDSL hydrolase family protein [Oscillospiraceae bacterium]